RPLYLYTFIPLSLYTYIPITRYPYIPILLPPTTPPASSPSQHNPPPGRSAPCTIPKDFDFRCWSCMRRRLQIHSGNGASGSIRLTLTYSGHVPCAHLPSHGCRGQEPNGYHAAEHSCSRPFPTSQRPG